MAKLSITKAWDDSRPIIARDGRLMFAVALATVVLPGTLMYLIDPSQNVMGAGDVAPVEPNFTTFMVSLLGGLIGLVGSIAISYLALTRGASVGDGLRRGLNRLLPTIGAVLLLVIPMVMVVMLIVFAGVGLTLGSFNPQSVSGLGLLLMLALLVIAMLIAIRLMLMTPVIAAEDGGPVQILARSWNLTRGHALRLFGFLILFLVGAVIVMMAVGVVAGLVIALMFGAPEPMSMSALATGLFATIVQAAFTIVYSTMVARIYLQLADKPSDPDAQTLREPRVSVPDSGGEG